MNVKYILFEHKLFVDKINKIVLFKNKNEEHLSAGSNVHQWFIIER